MIWNESEVKKLVSTPPFSVEEVALIEPKTQVPLEHKYYRIKAPSWVNILALTSEGFVILVKQPRVGIMAMTLEVPGGGIDETEEPLLAASRELEEETGYRPGKIIPLGSISPNPAIMTNKLHMFLATNCFKPEQRQHHPDAMERIEVVTMRLNELIELIKEGRFENALGSLTVLMATQFYQDHLR